MKALIKILICSIVYYSGLINLLVKRLSGNTRLPIVILVYHRITKSISKEINSNLTINHPLNNFIREMKILKKWFKVVSLDEAIDTLKNKPIVDKPTVVITYDDGFEDNYKLAFPVLSKYNLPATIYLTAGLIGSNNLPWVEQIGQSILFTNEGSMRFSGELYSLETVTDKRDAFDYITAKLKEVPSSEQMALTEEIVEKLGPDTRNMRMLNWEEVKVMSKSNITFGSHTMTHPILSRMPENQAKKEIIDSKKLIEEKTDLSVKHFAFPNGRYEDFSDELKAYCKEIGFESISTAEYGSNGPGSDVFALQRISPGKTMPIFAVDLLRAFLREPAGSAHRVIRIPRHKQEAIACQE